MQQLLIIADGMADDPSEGPTALQLADTPAINRLAQLGRTEVRSTAMPDGSAPGSDFAILTILGYTPAPDVARGPFEALGVGLKLSAGETAFRCNFSDSSDIGISPPPTPHQLTTKEIDSFCLALTNEIPDSQFVRIDGIHAVAVLNRLSAGDVMAKARMVLANHPVNRSRAARGLRPVNEIILWGGGKLPTLKPIDESRRSIVVCGVPLLQGIAKAAGMDCSVPNGATGDLSTDYSAKRRAAIKALNDGYDFVLLHIEAPDTASHLGNQAAKIHAIEQIDRLIIAPLLKHLQNHPDLTITLTADHATSPSRRIHLSIPFHFITTAPTATRPS